MVDQYLRWQAKGFAKLIAEAESNSSNTYFLINFLVPSDHLLTFKHYFVRFLGNLLISDVIFDVTMRSQPFRENHNIRIMTSPSVFHPKTLTHTHLETNTIILLSFLVFQMIFGPFWVILRVHDVTKVVKILKVSISGFIAGFSSPKNLPMHIFRSKLSFY